MQATFLNVASTYFDQEANKAVLCKNYYLKICLVYIKAQFFFKFIQVKVQKESAFREAAILHFCN